MTQRRVGTPPSLGKVSEPRIDDLTPQPWPPSEPADVLAVVKAIYPPARASIVDVMKAYESVSLDDLVTQCGLSRRSVCHHLRELYRIGLAVPDPERRDEQGRALWTANRRMICWDPYDFEPGSEEFQSAWAAMLAGIRHQHRTLTGFLNGPEPMGSDFREATQISDQMALASPDEMQDLWRRIRQATHEWREALPTEAPDGVERRPVRVTTWIHPVE